MRLAFVLVCVVMTSMVVSEVAAAKDLYATLKVGRGASKREIKRAYRKLSRTMHPDKNPDDPEAESKFMEVTRAYEVLTDDKLKAAYDRGGERGLEQAEKQAGGGGGGFNPFAEMFGFGGGGNGGGEKRGPSVEIEFEVSLEELYSGTELEAQVAKQVICPSCDGSGAEDPDDVATCPVCKGRGVTITRHQMAPGFVQQMQTTCKKCGGKGKIVKSICSACGGAKVVPGSSIIDLYIEAGAPDGHRLEFPMEGDQAPDTVPGDIVFVLRSAPHEFFARDPNGVDLHTRIAIPLIDALVGFEAEFEHLDGHSYTVENAGITKPGQILRIEGEGMPHYEISDARGDLFVTVDVVMPKTLSTKQKAALRDILSE